MACIMSVGIIVFHKNIPQITHVIFYASIVNIALLGMLHLVETYKHLFIREPLAIQ